MFVGKEGVGSYRGVRLLYHDTRSGGRHDAHRPIASEEGKEWPFDAWH